MNSKIIQNQLRNSFAANAGKVAIEQGDQKVLYAELLQKANSITALLVKQQLPKGTFIGISLVNRTDIIAATIGVMNAGHVFVPIDGTQPQTRLDAIVNDICLEYLISTIAVQPAIKFSAVANIYLFDDIAANATQSNIEVDFDGDDSIYVYFTSGTTGKPKGIIGKNSSLQHFINWEINEFDITNQDRFSQFISPYFDAFLRDIFVPLLAGGTICIPPASESFFSPENVGKWIEDSNITMIHCVPSVFRSINTTDINTNSFSNLRYVLLSGERIIPEELTHWFNVLNNRIQLVNLYGASETTMIRSFHRIQAEDIKQKRIPVGRPIADSELLILRDDLKPCGALITGEIYIVSDYLTKGYLNDPELNSKKFVKLTLPRGEVIAFKTGDKARMLASGVIDLIGREDRQIKLRGIRIELDEVEALLRQSNLLKDVIVIAATEENQDQSLVAFVTKNEGGLQDDQLLSALEEYNQMHIPFYMAPSRVVVLDAFPLLSNGKINYKQLADYKAEEVLVLPQNDIENRLLIIWKELLGDKVISTDAAFNTQGGSSLTIMRLIAKIYKEFDVRITLTDLFKNMTIQKQAVLVAAAKKDDSYTIPVAPFAPAYHLSATQERIYFNYALNPNSTAYNLPMAWELSGKIDSEKIGKALSCLIERHESLRTIFKVEQGELLQVIVEELSAPVEKIISDDDNAVEAINALIRPFDLARGPLIRCGIIILPSAKKILVMDVHHIVCDGISQTLLYTDFLKIYKGEHLQPLSIQYKDYAEWEFGFKKTHNYIALREFWLKEFETPAPALDLPCSVLHEDNSQQGGNVIFAIDKQTYQPLFNFLKEEGITTFSGLFAIFYVFLAQLTGQDDLVIGVNTAGRIHEEVEKVIGMFVKTLPVRNKINTEATFKSFVQQVHNHFVKASSKQLYDLADIISELNKGKDAAVKSLFEAMFVFQNYERELVETNNLQFIQYEFENKTFKYPVTLFCNEGADAFHFRLEYASKYFTKADAELIAEQFETLTVNIGANPNALIIEYGDTDLVQDNKEINTAETFQFNF